MKWSLVRASQRKISSFVGLALFTAGALQHSWLSRPVLAQSFPSGLSQPFCQSSDQAQAQKFSSCAWPSAAIQAQGKQYQAAVCARLPRSFSNVGLRAG